MRNRLYFFGFPVVWARPVLFQALAAALCFGASIGFILNGDFDSKWGIILFITAIVFLYIEFSSIFTLNRKFSFKKISNNELYLPCPSCGYELFDVDSCVNAITVCPECGSEVNGDDALKAWRRVPNFRRAYKNINEKIL